MLVRVKESHIPDGKGFPCSYYPEALGGVLDLLDSSIFASWNLSQPNLAAMQLKLLDKTMRTLAQATIRANTIADSVVSLSAREDFPSMAEQELAWLRLTMEQLSTQCSACNRNEQ